MKQPITTLAACLFALVLSRTTSAEIIVDPKPPMRWSEILECELVVVASYAGHKDGTLTLRVHRVLRGDGIRAGEQLTVNLRHWYNVQTGHAFPEPRPERGKGPASIPKLCYKQQLNNPGGLVPVKVIPDVCKPHVYFFPKRQEPALVRRAQVQLGRFAGEWKKALDGEPMGLLFRLTQNVHPRMAEAALEKLNLVRDSATIEELIRWIIEPPTPYGLSDLPAAAIQAERMLTAIGDNHDVYDRARKSLMKGTEGHSQYLLARLMAATDPDRALGTFKSMLQERDMVKVAAYSLGYVPREEALLLSFEHLRNAELADAGYRSIHSMLIPNGRSLGPSPKEEEVRRFRRIAKPLLEAALQSPEVPERVKKRIQGTFRWRLPLLEEESAPVDWEKAEAILMNPKDKTYEGLSYNGGASKLYRRLIADSNPRAIPLLVKVLDDLPEARGHHSNALGKALLYFARLCPNRMRRALKERALLRPFGSHSESDRLMEDLEVTLRLPSRYAELVELFRQPGGPEWLKRQTFRDDIIKTAKHNLDRTLRWRDPNPAAAHLAILLELEPEACEGYVERYLEHPGTKRDTLNWTMVLVIGVRCGKRELLEDLIERVRSVVFPAEKNPEYYRAWPLLSCGEPETHAEFLRILDEMPKSRLSPFSNTFISNGHGELLSRLMLDHAGEYFARIVKLLESEHRFERRSGRNSVRKHLKWDFGFDPDALKPERDRTMAQVRARLDWLKTLTEPQMRAAILGMRGITLKGRPDPSWLPALKEAALKEDPAIAGNALELIGLILGRSPVFLEQFPPARRRPALEAFLTDR